MAEAAMKCPECGADLQLEAKSGPLPDHAAPDGGDCELSGRGLMVVVDDGRLGAIDALLGRAARRPAALEVGVLAGLARSLGGEGVSTVRRPPKEHRRFPLPGKRR